MTLKPVSQVSLCVPALVGIRAYAKPVSNGTGVNSENEMPSTLKEWIAPGVFLTITLKKCKLMSVPRAGCSEFNVTSLIVCSTGFINIISGSAGLGLPIQPWVVKYCATSIGLSEVITLGSLDVNW